MDCKGSQSMGLSPELNRTCDAALIESKAPVTGGGLQKWCEVQGTLSNTKQLIYYGDVGMVLGMVLEG